MNNAEQMADLGSSQHCEHANREVILRAPTSLHYGNSVSLDFSVAATAAFFNEGKNTLHRFVFCCHYSLHLIIDLYFIVCSIHDLSNYAIIK